MPSTDNDRRERHRRRSPTRSRSRSPVDRRERKRRREERGKEDRRRRTHGSRSRSGTRSPSANSDEHHSSSHGDRRERRRRDKYDRRGRGDRSRSHSPSRSAGARKDKKGKERDEGRRREREHRRSRSPSRSISPEERRGRKEQDKRDRKRKGRYDRSHSRTGSPSTASGESSRSSSPHERRKRRKEDDDKREGLRKQKELQKALETVEEKRARRLAKKEAKLRKQREKEGWDQEYLGYTNTDNPFGDQRLLDKFVWHKKRDQDVTSLQVSKKEVDKREKLRQEEMKRELEKVKKRRIEREKDKEAREEEMFLLQRMKEAEMFSEWESQEDNFHLNQAKLRSQIRIESGRAKPIDLLARYTDAAEDDMDTGIEVQEPYYLLRGLNIVDLEDLMEDINVYCELEKDTNLDFWKDMIVICEDEIQKLKRLETESSGGGGAERRGGVNMAVYADVSATFKGKTHDQLQVLEQQINGKIHGAEPGTDVGYWESLLGQLKAFMAKAQLKDRHQAMLRKKLFNLKQKQAEQFGIVGTPLFPSAGPSGGREEEEVVEGTEEVVEGMEGEEEKEEGGKETEEEEVEVKPKPSGSEQPGPSEAAAEEPDTLIDEQDLLQQAYDDYDAGTYSPKLLKPSDIEEGLAVSEGDEESWRTAQKQRVLSGEKAQPPQPRDSGSVEEYQKIKMTRSVGADGMAEEEYDFNEEVTLAQQNPIWKEKYRPRKPRFFNRVHTGFEWNKYNQTHYDTDNPPPKIVQGYKFNIFYPDLINKRKTPQYKLTPCQDDSPDFVILRFHAGPPYEDIGFKIVNREWDYSWKHGFRSQFNNNILQLWFRFKRNRYRR